MNFPLPRRFSRITEIRLLAVAWTLFLAMLAVPYIKYLFVLYFVALIIYGLLISFNDHKPLQLLGRSLRLYWPHIMAVLSFLLAFGWQYSIPGGLFKEAVAAVVSLVFGFFFLCFIRSREDIEAFRDAVLGLMVPFSLLVIVLVLVKAVLVFTRIEVPFFMTAPQGGYPIGASLLKDYNYFSLALLVAFTGVAYLLYGMADERRSGALQVVLAFLATIVLLTSSRRGVIVLVAIHAALFLVFLRSRLSTAFPVWARFMRNMRLYGLSLMVVLISLAAVIAADGRAHDVFTGMLGLEGDREARFLARYRSIVPEDASVPAALADTRWGRYRLAWELFSDVHTGPQKLVGAGFSYIGRYVDVYWSGGAHDAAGAVDYDYPHNPLLSALLYGGVLGCAIIIIYLCAVIRAWARVKGSVVIFAVWQAIFLFFAFFSGNSIFSTPWFVVLSFLPFLPAAREEAEERRAAGGLA